MSRPNDGVSNTEVPEVLAIDAPDAQLALEALSREVRTAQLATVDREGLPEVSYSPFVPQADGRLLIYVSALAKHTGNLHQLPVASLMLVEDETHAATLYARRRATWRCTVDPIARDDAAFGHHMSEFRERFGPIIDELAKLRDFRLLALTPGKGRLVLGFGAAFALDGWTVQALVRGRHRSESEKPANP